MTAGTGFTSIARVVLVAGVLGCASDSIVDPPDPSGSLLLAAVSATRFGGYAGRNVSAVPTVRLTDGHGRGVRGIPITFSADSVLGISAGGAVVASEAVTDSGGYASAGAWELAALAGEQTLRAWISGAAPPSLDTDTVIFVAQASLAGASAPPSGKIAFVRLVPPSAGETRIGGAGVIYTVNLDGLELTRLTVGDDAAPQWSPDGSQLAFSHYVRRDSIRLQRQLCVMAMESREQRCIEATGWGWRPAWSPDGRELAYIAWDDSGQLRLYATDVRRIREIAVVREKTTRACEEMGSAEVSVSWSPANRIAFTLCGQVHTINPDGSGLQTVPVPFAVNYSAASVAWSPDGKRLVLGFDQWDCWENCHTAIGVARPDGTDLRVLATGGRDPVWSPDGSTILYAAGRYGATTVQYILADGSAGGTVIEDGLSVSWGP
jgi:hypothetical protein